MEVRELLAEFGFDGDATPIVTGSALNVLQVKLSVVWFCHNMLIFYG